MKKKISVLGTKFIDEVGHEVVLHGINMVCKDKSRNYIGDYTKDDFQMLKSWGFNIIRFGIFWDGVEPEPGRYNDSYLEKIASIIELAEQNDLVVYLDMHQDLFSCLYSDGAPKWATLTEGIEHIKTELWSESYLLSPAVQTAFDRFWQNEKASDGIGIQDHFIHMWQHIAAYFKDTPTIIGYDLFNEPFPGSVVNGIMGDLIQTLGSLMKEEPGCNDVNEEMIMNMWLDQESKLSLLNQFNDTEVYQKIVSSIASIPQEFDKQILTPFYQAVGDAIRSVDPYALLFLEANYFSNAGVPCNISPVKTASGQIDPYQIYSAHGYDLMVDTSLYDVSSFERLDVIFETHKKVQEALQIPILIGEWGCFPDAGEAQLAQANYLKQLFDRMQMSDTYYDFSHIKNNLITNALIRPYPMHVVGSISSYQYQEVSNNSDSVSKDKSYFECKFVEGTALGESIFFIPNINSISHIDVLPDDSGSKFLPCEGNLKADSGEKPGYLIVKTSPIGSERTVKIYFN